MKNIAQNPPDYNQWY